MLPLAVANSHREAPTTLDQAAAITDFYAFRSFDDALRLTFILRVDSAFDPTVVYSIQVDNASFEFRLGARATYSVAAPHGIVAAAPVRDKVQSLPKGVRVFAGTRDIALEVPRESPLIRAWAAAYRARTTVRRTAGAATLV